MMLNNTLPPHPQQLGVKYLLRIPGQFSHPLMSLHNLSMFCVWRSRCKVSIKCSEWFTTLWVFPWSFKVIYAPQPSLWITDPGKNITWWEGWKLHYHGFYSANKLVAPQIISLIPSKCHQKATFVQEPCHAHTYGGPLMSHPPPLFCLVLK